MALKVCMNILCKTSSSTEWKTGWMLRSGEFAILCDKCGYAFERHNFCEEFHGDDTGWRECATCAKQLHCGCIASLSLIELLDCGGVRCIGCARNLGPSLNTNAGKCDGSGPFIVTESNVVVKQFPSYKEKNQNIQLSTVQNHNSNVAFGLLKQEELLLPPSQAGSTWVSNLAQSSMGFFQKPRVDVPTISLQGKDSYGSMGHPNLNITLGVPSVNLQGASSTIIDEGEQRKNSDMCYHGLFPAPPKPVFPPSADTTSSPVPQIRVARPPVEGRGRHQLLPRYWPRITDQELQQITGDSNCTIVPLFEKVLSASDAGRIGRLVLPKACAEAYFPPISQPEGLPIKIQDVKGKEWLFQFRFWPNNNSRMYVLEGVTPCIQSMQLQAGDTVTFSRMDPEGKLVMGFRKASNSTSVPSVKGSADTYMNAFSRQMDSAGGNAQWKNSDKSNEPIEEGTLSTSMYMLERKRSRNIGSKSKRLLIDSQDVMALRLTWEEVQGLLRPPQAARPSVVMVEDYEFEEYEEPPVFGKNSVFTARSTGVVEQWVQCDNCSKWRRLPGDILLPPKWVCEDNAWDQIRCFCSAPEELSPKERENIQQMNKDIITMKRRMVMANKMAQEQESSGLNTMPPAAASGDNIADPATSSVAATTKHPRHRPGCSCIVCIQPPSGKGKHKSTCTCTVCMTVKRRFKTLMMRKKKRQSEQEADIALKNQLNIKEDDKSNVDNNTTPLLEHQIETEGEVQVGVGPTQANDGQGLHNQSNLLAESGKSLDLNCHPERSEASLTSLLQLASLPLEAYMMHNGISSLSSEQGLATAIGDIGKKAAEDHPVIQGPSEQGNPSNGGSEPENEQHSDPL